MTSASTPIGVFEDVHAPAKEEPYDLFDFDDSQVVLKANQITWFPLGAY